MTIHTVGDSHSCNGWEGITTHYLGAILCYSFGMGKLDRCDISKFGNLEDGDTIIFCLGEIDCRCHVHKHISDSQTYMDIIDKLVNNYFEAIEINISVSQIKFKNICVYNVVPPIQKYNTPENPEFPFMGSDEERKQYVLYFNNSLKEKCFEKGYVFFDVYDKYADENGFLRKDLSDDNVHIRNGIYITEFINNYLL